MANGDCIENPRAGPLTRPRYEAESYLTAADCSTEQNYRLQRLRRHNRQLHGWGVVCGLLVAPARDTARPWTVQVCPGYAVGAYGDEIEVRERASVDIREFLWSRPGASFSSALGGRFAYVVVRYREQPDRLLPTPSAACECEEPAYAHSRLIDGFEVGVLWTPEAPSPRTDLCSGSVPCPVCPQSPWLYLASVVVPAGTAVAITTAMIDNGIRRNL
jgi:hypothetical protein